MQKNGQAGLNILLGVVVMLFLIGLIVMIFVLMSGEISDTLDVPSSSNDSYAVSDTFISNLSFNNSLTYNNVTSLSATVKNRTWLSFDGTDDVLLIDNGSYETISFWVNNSTVAWTHVVNTSGVLYENGDEVSSLTLYPAYHNITDWYIGMTNRTYYANCYVDEIKFYNNTINETIVDRDYVAGR